MAGCVDVDGRGRKWSQMCYDRAMWTERTLNRYQDYDEEVKVGQSFT